MTIQDVSVLKALQLHQASGDTQGEKGMSVKSLLHKTTNEIS